VTAPAPRIMRLVAPLTLHRIAARYHLRHPLQTMLMIVGIMLGVAVAVAVDLANASATKAFDLSVDTVAGKATHQIVGGPSGLNDSLYTELRRQQPFVPAAPLLVAPVSSAQLGNARLQLLGVDPFAEGSFRNYLGGERGAPIGQLTDFFTMPGAILLSEGVAHRYRLHIGDSITLAVGGQQEQVTIVGLLRPEDDLTRRALEGLILCDIATAQELTGRIGKLDRIDLILPEDATSALSRIASGLPPGAHIQPVAGRTGTLKEMTAAFRLNLTALSLLAMVVGMFLIYNTITFSVVQRRAMLGTLRCLGVTRREIFTLIIGESIVIGVIGSAFGVGLGILLGQSAVQAVTQTINDLYFTLTVTGVQIAETSLIKGALLGIVCTVLAAAPPAWEAASVAPRAALRRSTQEQTSRQSIRIAALVGILSGALGAALLALPTRDLIVSFAGTFAAVMSFALITPMVMVMLMVASAPITGRIWGSIGRMGPRNVVNSASRTAVAVSALMVAISVTIGVSVMVSSFRSTVIAWLAQTLQSDIYIVGTDGSAAEPSTPINPEGLRRLQTRPEIERIDTLRAVIVNSPHGPIRINATDNLSIGHERLFQFLAVPPEQVWDRMNRGEVLVSEPLANRLSLSRNEQTLTLETDTGPKEYPIIGVYYDYTSSQGTALMALTTYRKSWHDNSITAIGLRLQPDSNVDTVAAAIQSELTPIQQLSVQPNRKLRENVLQIFDRTFAITAALQILATLVAFVGILSAFLALELEKQREVGILRAIGVTTNQIWGVILLETGLMGLVAGLVAIPTGLTLSAILTYIINLRSFGWTLTMQPSLEPFAQALGIAVIAALLAGLYPAQRMSRISPAEALHYE